MIFSQEIYKLKRMYFSSFWLISLFFSDVMEHIKKDNALINRRFCRVDQTYLSCSNIMLKSVFNI